MWAVKTRRRSKNGGFFGKWEQPAFMLRREFRSKSKKGDFIVKHYN